MSLEVDGNNPSIKAKLINDYDLDSKQADSLIVKNPDIDSKLESLEFEFVKPKISYILKMIADNGALKINDINIKIASMAYQSYLEETRVIYDTPDNIRNALEPKENKKLNELIKNTKPNIIPKGAEAQLGYHILNFKDAIIPKKYYTQNGILRYIVVSHSNTDYLVEIIDSSKEKIGKSWEIDAAANSDNLNPKTCTEAGMNFGGVKRVVQNLHKYIINPELVQNRQSSSDDKLTPRQDRGYR